LVSHLLVERNHELMLLGLLAHEPHREQRHVCAGRHPDEPDERLPSSSAVRRASLSKVSGSMPRHL
jgi:hypothetical protein